MSLSIESYVINSYVVKRKWRHVKSVYLNKQQNPTTGEYKLNVLESTDLEENHCVKNYKKVKVTDLPDKVKEKLKGK